ncbi:MAG: CopG family transcriptional regulator [Desulfurococcales archaeon]|jgi:hypothetical protein|nr:CopG family transcriptional regulator [Desulfurococcales archaeon]
MGSPVAIVKIWRDVKERIDRYRGRVNWAEEVRRFIEARLRELEVEENIRRVVETLSQLSIKSPENSSVISVREDREDH